MSGVNKRQINETLDQSISVTSSCFVVTADNRFILSCGYWDRSFRIHVVDSGRFAMRRRTGLWPGIRAPTDALGQTAVPECAKLLFQRAFYQNTALTSTSLMLPASLYANEQNAPVSQSVCTVLHSPPHGQSAQKLRTFCDKSAVFLCHGTNFFSNDRKKISQFGHNVRKHRQVNTVMASFNILAGQMTETPRM